MKLSYRGIVYEKELPLIEMETGEYGGRYRGQSWHYRYPRHVFNQNSNKINPLSRSTHSLSSLTTQAAFANDSSVCAVPMATALKTTGMEFSKTHLNNIRRNLERRLEAAKRKGDKQLINILKKESVLLTQQY